MTIALRLVPLLETDPPTRHTTPLLLPISFLSGIMELGKAQRLLGLCLFGLLLAGCGDRPTAKSKSPKKKLPDAAEV